jgi:succinate-semialdehyde dehydrogenase/glutarate-semialdehyde dehydrogenase
VQSLDLIDGAWQAADSGQTFPVLNPADDSLVSEVPDCGGVETHRAIEAAERARPAFLARPLRERTDLLRSISKLMDDRVDELADLITAEQGKPLAESRGEVAYAMSYLLGAADEADRFPMVEELDRARTGKDILIHPTSIGATAAITPWNFPIAMITKKVGPALSMGCTMVVKPAEQTPLSAIAFAEICMEAGLPPGVLNVITGRPEPIARALFENPLIRKVSFTGSTEVGRLLVRGAGTNLPRLGLELGGHAPFIVLEGVDLDAAVAGAIACKYRNGGQACISANRFLVQRSIHDEFVEKLRSKAETLKVGRGTEPGVQIGPMIDDQAMLKIDDHVRDALDHGARCILGGERVSLDGLADRFYAPTILLDCTTEMLCFREETFGPICPIRAFDTVDEAVRIANDSPFGLAAYLWAPHRAEAVAIARRLEVGVVGVNDQAPVTAHTPFGGVKHSGWGREGGRAALEEYVPVQTISIGDIQP